MEFPDVYHPLKKAVIPDFNWELVRKTLVKVHSQGNECIAISVQNNGEILTGAFDYEMRNAYKNATGFEIEPIQDPEKEVYILIKNAGIDQLSVESWENIISGKVFSDSK